MNVSTKLKSKEKRNMWLLISGMGVSQIGTLAFSFAVGLYILNMTGSGMSFAISMVLSALPRIIVSPIAGIMADRYSKKAIVVLGDLVSGCVVLALFFQTTITVNSLYLVVGSLSVVNTMFGVAIQASIPNLVDDDHLLKINSNYEAFRSIASIIGPMIGGVLFGFGTLKLIVLINGISFILSGISEMFIDFNYNVKEVNHISEDETPFSEVRSYLKIQPIFMMMLMMSLSFNFLLTMGINVPHTYMMNTILKISPRNIGIIEASISVGIILGSILISKVNPEKLFNALYKGSMGLALAVVLSGLPYLIFSGYSEMFNVIYQSLILVMAGFSLAVINVPVGTKMQKMAPEHLRGRLFSLFGMIGSALVPIGLMLSGYLINFVLPQYIMVVCGVLMMFTTVYFLSKEEFRQVFSESETIAEVDGQVV